jgi:hypothetical protein
MTLKQLITGTTAREPIRIFADCQTIYMGNVPDASNKEWNLKVLPYMNCNVVNCKAINGTIAISI